MTADYGIALFPQHAALLRASAISPDVARARNYQSVDTKARLASIDITATHRNVPGLLIPVYGPECSNGEASTWQYRPDHPNIDSKGRPVKYVTAMRGMVIDVPHAVRPHIGDPTRPLWITEGIRKVDSAVTAGMDCLGVLGVWNFRGTNANGGSTALAAWEYIAVNGRDVYLCFDSDVMVKDSVRAALRRFCGFLEYRKANVRLVILPDIGDGKTGLDDYLAAGGTVEQLQGDGRIIAPRELDKFAGDTATPKRAPLPPEKDGAALLDAVCEFVRTFVALPDAHALIATVLWCAHAHGVDCFESSPRIGYLAPEKACGKTRALEIVGLLVPRPMHAVNATPAALFRSVAQHPTVLYDEIDTVFGPRAKENEEVRGLLNAGHRRSGVAYRCVGEGTKQEVVAFPVYAAVAFAGIGELPDTIMSRTIVIPMRRRAPHETIEPCRVRLHEPAGHALHDRVAAWVQSKSEQLRDSWPDMPEGVTDRDADVWEPLLAIADAAGGHWPGTARAACVALVTAAAQSGAESLGVRLLRDLHAVFGDADAMATEMVIAELRELDESPWADLRGKPLNARGLANRLRQYGVRSKNIRTAAGVAKGYTREDLWDSWSRYVFSSLDGNSATSATPLHPLSGAPFPEGDGVADSSPNGRSVVRPAATSQAPDSAAATLVADVTRPPEAGKETPQWDYS